MRSNRGGNSEDRSNLPKNTAYWNVSFVVSLIFFLYFAALTMSNSPFIANISSLSQISCPVSYKPEELVTIYGESMVNQFHWNIRRPSKLSQQLFDIGVLHVYGYNRIEAQRVLKAAISIDPDCAMCYWALAMAYGPNINTIIEADDSVNARASINEAMKKLQGLTELEVDLINALNTRFAMNVEEWKEKTQEPFNKAFVNAMESVYQKHSDNADVAAIYAAAIIDLSPWAYFDSSRSKLTPLLQPAYDALKKAIELSNYKNQLALHLFIHISEQSPNPVNGEAAADALNRISGSDGTSHLIHMPGHLYIRIGRFADCIDSNARAVALDDYFLSKCLEPYVPLHNRALLVMAALSNGEMEKSIGYSFSVYNTHELAAVYLSALFPTPKELVYSRFGLWNEILELQSNEESQHAQGSMEKDNSLARELMLLNDGKSVQHSAKHSRALQSVLMQNRPYYLQVMRNYAHLIAELGLELHEKCGTTRLKSCDSGAMHDDTKLLTKVRQFSADVAKVPYDSLPIDHVFYPYHHELAQLMNATVFASYYFGIGRLDDAIDTLSTGDKLQRSFSYMEPENFYLPLQQCLGEVYLARSQRTLNQADVVLAKNNFLEDLREHPWNAWSLRGLIDANNLLSADKPKNRLLRSLMTTKDYVGHDPSTMSNEELQGVLNYIWKGDHKITGACCEIGICRR